MRAVVVAKTRMGRNVCVGAVAEHDGRLLRLIPRNGAGFHSWPETDFPFEVGDVLDIEGRPALVVEPPHTEDFEVTPPVSTGTRVDGLEVWIRNRCAVWRGHPRQLFGGRLESTFRGSHFLPRGPNDVQESVGFWELPFALYLRIFEKDDGRRIVRYAAAQRFGFQVKFVGLASEFPEIVPEGTLVRLSLARWWPEDDPKCWLQLSGWY